MSFWSRIANVFRGERVNREIDEELEAHVAEAMASGRDAAEARKALGSPLRHREESRDARIVTWIDSLRADAVFGWRQLKRTKVTSAAAILSLALAIGAAHATRFAAIFLDLLHAAKGQAGATEGFLARVAGVYEFSDFAIEVKAQLVIQLIFRGVLPENSAQPESQVSKHIAPRTASKVRVVKLKLRGIESRWHAVRSPFTSTRDYHWSCRSARGLAFDPTNDAACADVSPAASG